LFSGAFSASNELPERKPKPGPGYIRLLSQLIEQKEALGRYRDASGYGYTLKPGYLTPIWAIFSHSFSPDVSSAQHKIIDSPQPETAKKVMSKSGNSCGRANKEPNCGVSYAESVF
jgi:hypothetical protein